MSLSSKHADFYDNNTSADLEVQLMQLNHYDGVSNNY